MSARRLLVLVLGLSLGAAALAGTARTAEPCDVIGGAGTPYATVADLVAAMEPGTTGCLHGYPEGGEPAKSGLYDANVSIGKSGITLRSHPGEVAQIKGRLSIGAPDVTVSNLVLDVRNSQGHTGLRLSHVADRARLVDNDITSRSTVSCIWLDGKSDDSLDDVRIEHNRIHDCDVGVMAEYAGYSHVVRNLIYDNEHAGVYLAPDADRTSVTGNVIDRNAYSVRIGTGSDANYVGLNVLANPTNLNLGFVPEPGTHNVLGANCLWKDGGDGIDRTYVTTGWQFDKVLVGSNETANPGYVGAASESDYRIASSNRCHGATGDMSAAVSDNTRPGRAQSVNLRPNVLYIVSDDQRQDTMDMMPKTVARMKGAPGTGAGGTEYQQAFATTPLCCPARASLFTGLYAHNHLVKQNSQAANVRSTAMLARYLKDAGYHNGLYGKYLNEWHSSWHDADGDGVYQWCCGLIHTDQQTTDPSAPNYAIRGVPPNFDEFGLPSGGGMRESVTGAPTPVTDDSEYVMGKGIDFLTSRESADGEPWFLYLAPLAPHEQAAVLNGSSTTTPPRNSERWGTDAWHMMTDGTPYAGADVRDYNPPTEADLSDKPEWVSQWSFTNTGEKDNRAIFEQTVDGVVYPGLQKQMLRSLMNLDDQIDLLLAKLEETGEADDTLVVYVGDNGYQWREHSQVSGDCVIVTEPGYDEVFREEPCGPSSKGKPYLESIKIPLYVRWPDNPGIASGLSDPDKLVANIDVPTTVMDALDIVPAGTAAEPQLDGRSLLDSWTRNWVLTEGWAANVISDWRALVNKTTHFIKTDNDPNFPRDETWMEWYDLTQDPLELNNLYGAGGTYDPPFEPAPPMTLLDQYSTCSGSSCP